MLNRGEENGKNTVGSEHFRKLRCWESARHCGAKHISKPKCTKRLGGRDVEKGTKVGWDVGACEAHFEVRMYKRLQWFRSEALLEAEMLIKCTELWHEAHFEVQMHNMLQVRSTFGSWDVEKMQAAVVRSNFRSKCELHRHRPQIEKISETFFHAASMGQWYSGCLDKQISQHLPTQLTWANILWKRVLFCLVEWSKWWCVWTQRFACRIDITEVASKKKCFSLPPTISNLGTLKSHLKAILVPNDSSKSGNFHASVLLGFA